MKRYIWIFPVFLLGVIAIAWAMSLSSVSLADSLDPLEQRQRNTATPTGTRTVTVTPGMDAARGTEPPSNSGRTREIVRATATPDGFEPTPSATPGVSAARGGGGGDECVFTGQVSPQSPVSNIVVSADGTRGVAVINYGDKNGLTVLDFTNPDNNVRLSDPVYSVSEVSISNDGRWLITRDSYPICALENEFGFVGVVTRENNGATTYIWDLLDPAQPIAETDFTFAMSGTTWSDVYPAVLTAINLSRPDQMYQVVNIEQSDNILTLPPNTQDAMWSDDGRAIAAIIQATDDTQAELAVFEFTGDDLIQVYSETIIGEWFNIRLVSAANLDRVAVTVEDELIIYDFASVDTRSYALMDADIGSFNNLTVDWARNRFSVRESNNTTQASILRIQPLDGGEPVLIDIAGNLVEDDLSIAKVEFAQTRDEVLIESETSIFWWDFSTGEPELLQIFIKQPPTSDAPLGKFDQTGFVRWLLDETVVVVDGRVGDGNQVYIPGTVMVWDLTQSFVGTYVQFSADLMEFYANPEQPVIYGIDTEFNEIVSLDLQTYEAMPLQKLTEVQDYLALSGDADIYADFSCAGTLPPHLDIGNFVTVVAGDANNLRTDPSLSADTLDVQFAPGMRAAIIGGPVCADGLVWWQVGGGDFGDFEFRETLMWTVGGDNSDYWLEPVTPPENIVEEPRQFESRPLEIQVIGRTDGSSMDSAVVTDPLDEGPVTTPGSQPVPGDMVLVPGENTGDLAVGSVDTWSYMGRAGETITVTTNAEWDTTLEAFLNGDSLDFSDDADLPTPVNSQIVLTIGGDGDVIEFAVRGYADDVGGAYTLTLETDAIAASDPIPTVAPMPEGLVLVPGENTGDLAVGSVGVWSYVGRAGETITVTTNAEWDTTLEAFLNGDSLDFNDDADLPIPVNSQIVLTISGDGDVIEFAVRGYADDVGGAYTLTLETDAIAESGPIPTVAPMPEGLVLVPGENTGDLAVGSVDMWSYVGRAGETITVTTNAEWDTTLEAFLNGDSLAFNDDADLPIPVNSQIVLTISGDGDVIEFAVRGYADDVGGAYTLVLEID